MWPGAGINFVKAWGEGGVGVGWERVWRGFGGWCGRGGGRGAGVAALLPLTSHHTHVVQGGPLARPSVFTV